MTRRWWYVLVWAIALLAQNGLHEGVHYGVARFFGEPIAAFRFLTNGWGTSQVVFATPVAERAGAHWLAISWAPAVATVLVGYLLYLNRNRLIVRDQPVANVLVWYAGIIFLALDPLYYGLLSIAVGGDIGAVAVMGWSPWPIRAVALVVLAANVWLIVRWAGEIERHPELYRSAGAGE